MSLRRVRPWDWVAGALGVALLVVLALPWYDLADGSRSAFQQFAFVDIVWALTALLSIAIPAVTAWRESPELPVAVTVVAESVAWFAVLFALWRAIDQPGGPLDATAMPWVGLALVLGVAVAVWHALRDERAPGIRQPPPARTLPPPPRGAAADS